MSLMISCPSCKARLKAPENLIGKTVKCPQCQTAIAVKALADSPAAAPPRQAAKPPRKTEPDETFEDLDERPARKPAARKPRDEDDDDFTEAPPKKGKGRAPADDFDDLGDDTDDQPRKGKGKKGKTAGIPTDRVTEEDKTAAFNMYLYYIICAVVCSCAAPVVFLYMWLSKRKENPLLDWHGKQIVNLWITSVGVTLVLSLLQCGGGLAGGAMGSDTGAIIALVLNGLLGLVGLAWFVVVLIMFIKGMMNAKAGVYYRYPFVLHLLK